MSRRLVWRQNRKRPRRDPHKHQRPSTNSATNEDACETAWEAAHKACMAEREKSKNVLSFASLSNVARRHGSWRNGQNPDSSVDQQRRAALIAGPRCLDSSHVSGEESPTRSSQLQAILGGGVQEDEAAAASAASKSAPTTSSSDQSSMAPPPTDKSAEAGRWEEGIHNFPNMGKSWEMTEWSH